MKTELRRLAPGIYALGFTSCLIVRRDYGDKPWMVFVKEGVGCYAYTLKEATAKARKLCSVR